MFRGSRAPSPATSGDRRITPRDSGVAELSTESGGFIWLDPKGADTLGRVLTENRRLSWIQLPYPGVDAFAHILKISARPGLIVTSVEGAFAQPVAEHALMRFSRVATCWS